MQCFVLFFQSGCDTYTSSNRGRHDSGPAKTPTHADPLWKNCSSQAFKALSKPPSCGRKATAKVQGRNPLPP